MKKLILAAFILLSLTGHAQNAQQTKDGNYIAITQQKDTASKESGKTYTDSKGQVYPVYITPKGKLFVKKISKAGNSYKMYLKLN